MLVFRELVEVVKNQLTLPARVAGVDDSLMSLRAMSFLSE